MPRPLRPGRYRIPAGAEFGAKRAGGARTHQGTDYHSLDNRDGEPIYGTGTGGVVSHIGYNGNVWLGLGHNVTIKYPGGRVTTDGHMRDRTPLQLGSPVTPTTLVGHVGHSGSAVNADPPGSHDHHQMTINGVLVDPEQYYRNEPAGAGGTPIDDEEEDSMEPKVIGHKDQEIALIAAWLPLGRRTAKIGSEVANGWARLYSPTKDSLVPMYDRDVYLSMIAGAEAMAAGYQEALPKPGVGGVADNSEVLTAVAGVDAKVTGVATQISSFPAPPSPAEIAAAVNTDAAQRLAQ